MALELHGTTGVDLIQDGTVVTADLHSDVNSGVAKAWVNFNGTGTVAIRESYNVASITDNGTGNYNINFTTAMSDANYSAVTNDNYVGSINHGTTFSTTSYQVVSRNSSGSEIDNANICSVVFR
jgi:hypothetical protein